MKKEKMLLSDVRSVIIDIEAIASTSSFERKIDSKLETLARSIKSAIPVPISDKLDDIKAKRRKIVEKYKKEVYGKPKFEAEFQKLIMSDTYLVDAKAEEDELWDKEIDFDFNPVYVSEEQLDDAYENFPMEDSAYQGEQVEFKGDVFTVKRLRKKLRSLIDDGYLIIGEEKQDPAIKPLKGRRT